MSELIVAVTRTGQTINRVAALRDAVTMHLKLPHVLVCLTDQRGRCDGVTFIDTTGIDLPGQWTRLAIFEPGWRAQSRVIFLDLDVEVANDITPLADVPGEFAICEDPVNPRRYNSSVMVIGGGMAGFVWRAFNERGEQLMRRYTVRSCIEHLYPQAPRLQQLMPKGFFYARGDKATTGSVGL